MERLGCGSVALELRLFGEASGLIIVGSLVAVLLPDSMMRTAVVSPEMGSSFVVIVYKLCKFASVVLRLFCH